MSEENWLTLSDFKKIIGEEEANKMSKEELQKLYALHTTFANWFYKDWLNKKADKLVK